MLTVDELAWKCPENWLPWQDSGEIDPAETIVGQDRAVEAIGFGLGMRGIGFNVFVTGLSGTGRLTTIKRYLDREGGSGPPPDDICFVFNFEAPDQPNVLMLKAGTGRRLRDGMEAAVDELIETLPRLFSDTEFRKRAERAVGDLQEKERELVGTFETKVREAGFALVQIQAGSVTRPEILPVVGEEPVAMEELPKLVEDGKVSEEDVARITEQHGSFMERLQEVFQGVADLRSDMQTRVDQVRRSLVRPMFEAITRRIQRQVGDDRVAPYLAAVRTDFEEQLDLFAPDGQGGPDVEQLARWKVNLAVDNNGHEAPPVVLETEPTYARLFGTIERKMTAQGEAATSFVDIRAGSLLAANGGYLVLNAEDLAVDARVWLGLKRALKYRRVQIQSFESVVLGSAALKPEPVDLDVKVIVIGDRGFYDALYRYDRDFAKVFKVLADFDAVMPVSSESALDVLSVLRKVSKDEELLPMDRSGMAAILEVAVRMGRWRRRFSSRFSDLSDVLREASFVARSSSAEVVGREHVAAARRAQLRRHGLSEDRTHEYIAEGVVRIEVEGERVGQVNGLAVYDLGHHRFGKPSRITASIGLGREGVINIERQAGLSGPTHDKGVSILTGFLRGTFARKSPLTMACSVTFEQSYGGIDGDSASSTEIYAILSALSRLPLRQDVAVTGSVDQFGGIQAIGGANEKIEGFYRVCATRGLTGTQGVMIPASNVADLHLSEEVVEAVGEGKFHVWSAESVNQGIELMTGVPAGDWGDDEVWTAESVYARCQDRLEEMARLMRQAVKAGAAKADEADESDAETADETPDGDADRENDDDPGDGSGAA